MRTTLLSQKNTKKRAKQVQKGNSFSHNFLWEKKIAFKQTANNTKPCNWTMQILKMQSYTHINKNRDRCIARKLLVYGIMSVAEVSCILLTQPMDLRNWIFHRDQSKMHRFFYSFLPSCECIPFSSSVNFMLSMCFFFILFIATYFLQFLNICEAFSLHADACGFFFVGVAIQKILTNYRKCSEFSLPIEEPKKCSIIWKSIFHFRCSSISSFVFFFIHFFFFCL